MINKLNKSRGYFGIGLHHPKKDVNIGGALRACSCYGGKFITISGRKLVNYASNTTKAERHIPLYYTDNFIDIIPYNCTPIAVEINDKANLLFNFIHPERAFYIFGPENSSLTENIFKICKNIIYIPTFYCMNLAATVNVVLYDRMMKEYIRNNDKQIK